MNGSRLARVALIPALLLVSAAAAAAQSPAREDFPGVNKYWRVDATASTGGSITDLRTAIPEFKRRGFKAIVNLAGGPAAQAERAAVEAAGLKYLEFPLNPETLDPAPVGPFLKAVSDPANQPAFIHSGNGHRAGALWLIKRAVVDGWSVEKAGVEAAAAGLVNDNTMASRLWRFAYDYVTVANRPK
jgi:protein tyrosine phosphatase (PTP) superfamily phosphohydrolase (DUF442 family)